MKLIYLAIHNFRGTTDASIALSYKKFGEIVKSSENCLFRFGEMSRGSLKRIGSNRKGQWEVVSCKDY